MYFVSITPENIDRYGLFCSKNPKLKGFRLKRQWFIDQYLKGLRIHIAKNNNDQDTGFIEFTPVENAWRPVSGQNLIFIHCVMVNKTQFKGQGVASFLIQSCEEYALKNQIPGVSVLTSKGTWLASKSIYEKLGYKQVDNKGRFELMLKTLDNKVLKPHILDWEPMLNNLKGWHLFYSDQCPFLYKSVADLTDECQNRGIDLQVSKINSASEAKLAPSGYGVFTLVHEGKVVQDHYVSRTRFKNILKKEIGT